MKQKTTIQKVKELIEAVNLTKKRALGDDIKCDSFLEVIEESGNVLLIRSSNLDCFLLPKSLVLAIAKFDCSYMVSTRYHFDANEHFEEYPGLRLHFFDN